MTWVDLAIVGIIFLSAVLAFARGFSREALGLSSWVGAGILAVYAFPFARERIRGWFTSPDFVDPAAFAIVFAISLVISLLITKWVSSLVRMSVLGGVDRSLGAVFGVARGVILVVFSYVAAGIVVPQDRWPDPVVHARLMPVVFKGAAWAVARLPSDYAPRLEQPPTGSPDPTAEDLTHTVPQGRATAVATNRPARPRTGEPAPK